MSNTHPKQSTDEQGRGEYIFSDWQKECYTYGQCDRSITTEEYERTKREGGFIVDPFTGEAEYDIEDSDIDGKVPDDLVGVLIELAPVSLQIVS